MQVVCCAEQAVALADTHFTFGAYVGSKASCVRSALFPALTARHFSADAAELPGHPLTPVSSSRPWPGTQRRLPLTGSAPSSRLPRESAPPPPWPRAVLNSRPQGPRVTKHGIACCARLSRDSRSVPRATCRGQVRCVYHQLAAHPARREHNVIIAIHINTHSYNNSY